MPDDKVIVQVTIALDGIGQTVVLDPAGKCRGITCADKAAAAQGDLVVNAIEILAVTDNSRAR